MIEAAERIAALFGIPPESKALASLSRTASIMTAGKDSTLFASGDVCENFVIVSSGRARVQLSTRTGREITLYRLEPGQSCALTTSCLLSETPYYAEGIAETDLELITIPAVAFREAAKTSPDILQVLVHDFASRIAGLTAMVDRLTSRDINHELAALLIENADRDHVVSLSHKSIAEELGTAREVISRRLKDWERQKLLKLRRGSLVLVEPEKIEKYIV